MTTGKEKTRNDKKNVPAPFKKQKDDARLPRKNEDQGRKKSGIEPAEQGKEAACSLNLIGSEKGTR